MNGIEYHILCNDYPYIGIEYRVMLSTYEISDLARGTLLGDSNSVRFHGASLFFS